MGFFYGLRKEEYDREYSDRELVRRIYNYFRPHAKEVFVVAVLTVTTSLIAVVPRIVTASGLDVLVGDRSNLVVLMGIIGAILVGGVVDWGGNWIRGRLLARVTGSMMQTLRDDAFSASMRHDLSFFDEFRSGRIISRITSDTEEFANVVQLVTDFLGQVLQVVFLFAYMASISWRLTLMVLGFVPVVLVVAMSLRRLARKVTREGFQVMAEVNAAIQEAVTGISVAKNFRQEAAIYDGFSEINEKSYKVNLRRGYTLALSFPMLNALSGIGTAVVIYAGGRITATTAITVGSWYLFVTSMDRFWFPILSISAFWNQFQGGLAAAERVFALIDAEARVVQTDDRPVGDLRGEIDFHDVDFRYSEQEQVLEGFSVHIEPGESIALVGHTGAGKSSIANLIARFYEFQDGTITVDGQDIRTFDLTAYRRQLGIVSQMPFLFSGTVAENIRYGRIDVTDAEILEIANEIGDGGWLSTLPNGLETDVGERGSQLSMGQRQLVALMRVLVQHPAIFILDEATASIDPFTEAQIQAATELILSQSTSILIAHRLSTIRAVDRILVLREGEIIEEGSHDVLMAQGGHYAELYNTYFRHQSPDYRPPAPEEEDESYLELLPQYRVRA
ncbi:MAG: ABC transporter ATP-binding protein [Anaerolineae bacterium]|nr:ABC transporter ATP-binding protein [Anaerolineae bacterium]